MAKSFKARIYKLGKKYRLDYFNEDGVRRRIRFPTWTEANNERVRIEGELKAGTHVDPNKIPTFKELADSWMTSRLEASKEKGKGYRPSTLAAWQTQIDNHLIPRLGKHPVNEIDVGMIEQARVNWVTDKVKGGHGLSDRTANKVLTTLVRILNQALTKGFIRTFNPAKLAERAKKDGTEEQTEDGQRIERNMAVTEENVLTPEEIKRLILAAKPGLYRTIITTIAYTGMRHDEALALRWSDVEPLEAGEVRVTRTLSTAKVKGEENQNRFRWFDPKTQAGRREIPIPKELIDYLRDWKAKCPKSRHDLVFPSPLGEPLHRSNILRSGLYPAIEQAGVNEITMHGLRHSYAAMLITLKKPITEVSRYLGHKDVSVTMRIYAHFLKPKEKDSMTDLARMINGA